MLHDTMPGIHLLPSGIDRPIKTISSVPRPMTAQPHTDTFTDRHRAHIHAMAAPAGQLYLATKRVVDVAVALTLLVTLSPLALMLALAIRLDSPGPAIFAQERVGRNGRPFRLYKFRTMTHNPTGELVWLVDEHGEKRHKLRCDPRVTRVGRWLRRTSADEAPQLWNILRGDMSLIGPRPELPEIVSTYEPWQHERHVVRPGLTGLWQISGRSDKPMHQNTELDIYYIRHRSFGLDVLILVKTLSVVVRGLGAF